MPMLRIPSFSVPRPPATAASSSSPTTCYSKEERLVHHSGDPDLKRLTSRIFELTRCRQLRQILEEVEVAKRRYGQMNTIVMNAVMEACVHCNDVDAALGIFDEMGRLESCGVDNITYGTLLKGLGDARRIYEAFAILESVEQGTVAGNPKLSTALIGGLLNALIEAGCSALRGYARNGQILIQSMSSQSATPLSLTKPIETIMIPFEAARPLKASLHLREVTMCFFGESVVPIIDDWGSCVGLLHREDCFESNAELGTMMRSPPRCVMAAISTIMFLISA